MNIKSFVKLITRKVNKYHKAVENPIYSQDNFNPFQTVFNKTYVWVEQDED